MAKSITVRDVADETCEELTARAALTGRSVQEYLRAQLVKLGGGAGNPGHQADPRGRAAMRLRDDAAR